ncbi:Uncharacterised protein [Providencia rustigianii]|nr:Uncharacterised protein [Providencia rustigianii]
MQQAITQGAIASDALPAMQRAYKPIILSIWR